jgi:hypothetical protein
MSEKLHHSPEQAQEFAELKGAERKHETSVVSPEQQSELLNEARQEVHELASPKERLALPVDEKPSDNQPLFIDKTVKTLKFKQTLKQIRAQLPASQRVLSKVVHQPMVQKASELSAKTVTRPSGLLGGGLFAFVGSALYFYLAKHVGFEYNYLLFTLLFIGGFLVGVVLEFALWAVRPKHHE